MAEYFQILIFLSIAIFIISLLQCIFVPHDGYMVYNTHSDLKNPSNLPLLIEFYYDAMDNDSEEFVAKQLIPTYDIIKNVTEVLMVPYGNTHMSQNSNGSYEIRCSPQPDQCEPILQHTCVAGIVKDSHKKLRIIKCLMGNNWIMVPTESLEKCSQEFNLTDLEEVRKCANGALSLTLLSANRDLTEEASKGFYRGPFVIFNLTTMEPIKEVDNLLSSVCKLDGNINGLKNICKTIK